MKRILSALVLVPLIGLATVAQATCGGAADAEQAVRTAFGLDPSDHSVSTERGADETLAGGKFVYRYQEVHARSVHGVPGVDKYVVSYAITRSFDGPQHGDYCNRTGVQRHETFCESRADSTLCQ